MKRICIILLIQYSYLIANKQLIYQNSNNKQYSKMQINNLNEKLQSQKKHLATHSLDNKKHLQNNLLIEGQHYEKLAQPNPIQKRQKLKKKSIFSMLQLPQFQFPGEKQQPQPTFSYNDFQNKTLYDNKRSSWMKRQNSVKFELKSNQMTQIFKKPIFKYHQRVQCTNNFDCGCIKIKYSESNQHPVLQQNKINKISNFQQTQNNFIQSPKLQFQSRFQSGNLGIAAQSEQYNSYNLAVSRDMNTSKCTQWFFFRVKNNEAGTFTFNILNFIKSYSIFQNGMKICVASQKDKYIWRRGCEDIKYRKTNIPLYSTRNFKISVPHYYALSFSYTFKNQGDIVYFAYCYPYTFTMLQNFLFNLDQKHENKIFKRRNIAQSPGGNYIDLITITNLKKKNNDKKTVVITSRVHPGETPSSFVCEGIIKYLLGNSSQANALRDNFVFKIVPMLNPDGVINGSYRCSLSGYDLNRVWHRADKISHPEIYGTRKMMIQIAQKQKIFMFVDLHAHSKKRGIFMYGCQNRANPYLCRHIPFLLWKNIPQFNYYQCNFGMKKGRQGTSRLFIYQALQINYSYTMQHSFCGSSKQRNHFNQRSYLNIGQNFMLTLHKFFCRNKKQLQNLSEMQIFKDLYSDKQLLKIGEGQSAQSSSDEQLDKQKSPIKLENNKERPKIINKRENPRMSQGAIKNFKPTVRKTNLRNISKMQKQLYSKTQQIIKYPKFSFQQKQLPVVGMNFQEQIDVIDKTEPESERVSRERICFSSLTGTHKHFGQTQSAKKNSFRETCRYDEQDEINSLSNLFLPSLKSASYKKYSRKEQTKNIVHVGKTLIQDAIMKKQEIRPIERRKPIDWRERAKSFF